MSLRQRLFFLLKNNETAQSIAIALSVAGFLIGLIILFLEWPPSEVRAAASLNYSTIDYGKVTCVSIAQHQVTIEGKDIQDPKLAKSITDILSIRTVLFDAPYSQCPWSFFINMVPGTEFAVRNGLLPAQYLISIDICERTDERHVDTNKCLSKNVYVFNWRANPHDLFRAALIGLKPETADDELFTLKVADDCYSRFTWCRGSDRLAQKHPLISFRSSVVLWDCTPGLSRKPGSDTCNQFGDYSSY
jgi:hypothetical protein